MCDSGNGLNGAPGGARTPALAGLLVLLACAAPACAEEIVTVSGRRGEAQSYLLMNRTPTPKAVAVLFPGGEGLLRLHMVGDRVVTDEISARRGELLELDPRIRERAPRGTLPV